MSETTDPTFEIRATQLPSPPRTYQFSVWLEDAQVTDDYAFLWNFGDGGSSEQPSPIHTYTEAGDFDVNVDVKKIPDRDRKKGSQTGDDDPPSSPPPITVNVP